MNMSYVGRSQARNVINKHCMKMRQLVIYSRWMTDR